MAVITVRIIQNGDKLLQDDAIETMVNELFPVATPITPNIAETAELTVIIPIFLRQRDTVELD